MWICENDDIMHMWCVISVQSIGMRNQNNNGGLQDCVFASQDTEFINDSQVFIYCTTTMTSGDTLFTYAKF